MSIIRIIGDFLLSSWIWNITFDWYHPVVTGIVMFCLLRFTMHRRRLESFAISITAQFFAFGLLTANVVFGFIKMMNWQYEPLLLEEAMSMMNALIPCLSLGIIYAIAQSLFFIVGRCIRSYHVKPLLVLTWVSNGFGVIISYMLISVMELYYYIG